MSRLLGATTGDGRYVIERVRVEVATAGAYEGVDRTRDQRVLMAVTAGQRVDASVHRERLGYSAPGVAKLLLVGVLDAPHRENVLVETRPAGQPSDGVVFTPEQAVDLTLSLIDCARTLAGKGVRIPAWRPEQVFVISEGDGDIRFSGLAPRADWFFAHVPQQSSGVANPFPSLYIAPELLHSGAPSEASDVFAMGALLSRWTSGLPPFGGPDVGEVILNILNGSRAIGRVERPLRDLLDHCLQVDPANRPSVDELGAALRQLRKS